MNKIEEIALHFHYNTMTDKDYDFIHHPTSLKEIKEFVQYVLEFANHERDFLVRNK